MPERKKKMYFKRLKELRISKNMTQQKISELLHCHREVYRKYEIGERKIPIDFLIKLSRFYNVSIDYIVENEDNDLLDEKNIAQKQPQSNKKIKDSINNE